MTASVKHIAIRDHLPRVRELAAQRRVREQMKRAMDVAQCVAMSLACVAAAWLIWH